MRKLFFFLLLVPLLLFSQWNPFSEGSQDPTLFHHVNVITGDLNICIEDGTVQEANLLPIMRTYSSAGESGLFSTYSISFLLPNLSKS